MEPIIDPNQKSPRAEKPQEHLLLNSLYDLTETIQKFKPTINLTDFDWRFYLRSNSNWIYLSAKLYEDTWYVSTTRNSSRSLPYPVPERFSFNLTKGLDDGLLLNQKIYDLVPKLTVALRETYQKVATDPLRYHAELSGSLPPTMRLGLIPRAFVNNLLPEWFPFEREMTLVEIHKMQHLCEKDEQYLHSKMTAEIYFEYCRVAYLANSINSHGTELFSCREKLGSELYQVFADGRDGGLTNLTPNSEVEFANWFDQKRFAGQHPWEIYRGGNSSHIDLYVHRASRGQEQGWKIGLSAFSSTRLVETCRIALALEAAGLPFELAHKESYLKRLRCEDLIGIVPDGHDLRYGYHAFPQEFGVADSINFSFFKDKQGRQIRPWREISKVVSWMPIPPLSLNL